MSFPEYHEKGNVFLEWNDKGWIDYVRQAVEEASKEGAEIVAKEARRRVKKRTGKLHDEIDVRVSPYKDGGWSVFAQGPGNYTRFYAAFVELGTSDTVAQPFLRPALNANKRKINKIFKDKIEG